MISLGMAHFLGFSCRFAVWWGAPPGTVPNTLKVTIYTPTVKRGTDGPFVVRQQNQ